MRQVVLTTKDQARAALEEKRVFTEDHINKLLAMSNWQTSCTQLLSYCDELLGQYFDSKTQKYCPIVINPYATPDDLIKLATQQSCKSFMLPVPYSPLFCFYIQYLGSCEHHFYKVALQAVQNSPCVQKSSFSSPIEKDNHRTIRSIQADIHHRHSSSSTSTAGKHAAPSSPLARHSITVFSIKNLSAVAILPNSDLPTLYS